MNYHSRNIKHEQSEILKSITTDTPIYQWQKPVKGTGKGLLSVLNTGTRGSIHQGHSVTNFGSYIPDPRGANKGPASNSYMRRVAKQKRDQYEGPYLLADQEHGGRAIKSEITEKMKTEGVRRYAFRRPEMEDTIALDTRKMTNGYNQNLVTALNTEREPSRIHGKVNPLYLRSDFEHHEILDQSNYNLPQHKTKQNQHVDVANLFPNMGIRNIQSLDPKSIDRQTYRRINPLELIADIPTQTTIVNNKGKTMQHDVHINTLELIEKSLRDYEENKIPISKSRYLTDNQKSLINDYLKTGLTEKDMVNILYQTGQQIKKQGLLVNDFVSGESLLNLINERTKTWTPTQKMKVLHIYNIESPPTTVNRVYRNNVSNSILENNWVKNEEELYDDIGVLPQKATYRKGNLYDAPISYKPKSQTSVSKGYVRTLNSRQDYVYPTHNATFTNISRGTGAYRPSNSFHF